MQLADKSFSKPGLLAGLFLLAGVNRWFLTSPAACGDSPAIRLLVHSIAGATIFVLLILGAVAAWRFTPPPRAIAAAAAAPVAIHVHTAKAMADFTITPGRAGEGGETRYSSPVFPFLPNQLAMTGSL